MPSATTVRPRVDVELQRYVPLLDSLAAVTGVSPQRVRVGATTVRDGHYNPATETITIGNRAPDPRFALLHEYGHLFNRANMPLLLEWLGITPGQRPIRKNDYEGFADAFAHAFNSLSARQQPTDPRVQFILDRLLSTARGLK